VGDEGGEVAEGSWDIRVEGGECPQRSYLLPNPPLHACDSLT
jgi:hypothetical protein